MRLRHVETVQTALVRVDQGNMFTVREDHDTGNGPMAQTSSPSVAPVSPQEALRLLNEAWAYYTPQPRLVTSRNSQPAPVIAEYYDAA
jgi:hypothetical protein